MVKFFSQIIFFFHSNFSGFFFPIVMFLDYVFMVKLNVSNQKTLSR